MRWTRAATMADSANLAHRSPRSSRNAAQHWRLPGLVVSRPVTHCPGCGSRRRIEPKATTMSYSTAT
jgi:hypothetical protein